MSEQSIYNESELRHRIAEGDERAFEQLFLRFKEKLFGYIFSITRSHHQAEEITQELFIKLWRSRELLADIDNIDNYLFVMAKLRTISYLRTVLGDQQKFQRIYNSIKVADTNNAENGLIETEYSKLLESCIDKLSPQRKEVFLLSRQDGMKMEQIAARLGLSRNTVKNHLVEALKQIKKELAKHGIGLLLLFTALLA